MRRTEKAASLKLEVLITPLIDKPVYVSSLPALGIGSATYIGAALSDRCEICVFRTGIALLQAAAMKRPLQGMRLGLITTVFRSLRLGWLDYFTQRFAKVGK